MFQAPAVGAAGSGAHHLQTGPRGPVSCGPEGALGGEGPVGGVTAVYGSDRS